MNDKQILENAPEGATHYAQGIHYLAYNSSGNWMRYDPNGIAGFCWFEANNLKFEYVKSFRSLSDIKRIVELEKQNAEMRERLGKWRQNSFDLANHPEGTERGDKAFEDHYNLIENEKQLNGDSDE